MLVSSFCGVVLTLFVIVISYYKWSYQYWHKKKLPHLNPKNPFGNVGEALRGKECMGITMKRIYEEMKKRNWKHGGIYVVFSPNYFVLDLEYIKNIMTKDFHYFVDRTTYFNETDDPLSAHIANLTGNKWKNLRAKLTPTFTPGKMKMMFHILIECENNLQKRMERECEKKLPIDIHEIVACFNTDVIGSCVFGLDCNTSQDQNSPFIFNAKKNTASAKLQRFKMIFALNFPKLAKMFHLRAIPKDVSDFYMKVVNDTVDYREKNNYTRNDFLQLLIDMKNNKFVGEDEHLVEEPLTMNEISAQCFVFFLAGFETSSALMSFTLYELARNQDIQKKLRDEIKTVLASHEGRITYEALQEMKYMNQVLDESMRKYPPVPLTNRKCVKNYKLPDEDLIIEKGTKVVIPIMGIHYDEEYYPNPEKFDPDRFSEKNKNTRHPYTHLPFGQGPRSCIGLRFGLMMAKVVLTSLLRDYNFTVNKKTREPLKMHPGGIILAADGGIWLDIQKLINLTDSYLCIQC